MQDLYSFDELSDDAKQEVVSLWFPRLPEEARSYDEWVDYLDGEFFNGLLECHRDKVHEIYPSVNDIEYQKDYMYASLYSSPEQVFLDSGTWTARYGSGYVLDDLEAEIYDMYFDYDVLEAEADVFMEPVIPSIKAKVPEADIEWPSEIEAVAHNYDWKCSNENWDISDDEIMITAYEAYCEAIEAAARDITFDVSLDIGLYVNSLSSVFASEHAQFDQFGELISADYLED